VKSREIVLARGRAADALLIVPDSDPAVLSPSDANQAVATIRASQVVAEESLLDQEPTPRSVAALADATVLESSSDSLHARARRDPDFDVWLHGARGATLRHRKSP
jgi:hypothetical protein